jgi:hypothetical protein
MPKKALRRSVIHKEFIHFINCEGEKICALLRGQIAAVAVEDFVKEG